MGKSLSISLEALWILYLFEGGGRRCSEASWLKDEWLNYWPLVVELYVWPLFFPQKGIIFPDSSFHSLFSHYSMCFYNVWQCDQYLINSSFWTLKLHLFITINIVMNLHLWIVLLCIFLRYIFKRSSCRIAFQKGCTSIIIVGEYPLPCMHTYIRTSLMPLPVLFY